MKALLFSGGIDSTALAWGLRPDLLIFLDYGQKAAAGELRAARSIAKELDLPIDVRQALLGAFGHGLMAGSTALNPSAPEFWPYRNQLLITLAVMAHADSAIKSLIIGTVKGDDRHPDGKAKFLAAMNAVLAVQSGPLVEAPAARMTSEELVLNYQVPLAILGWTFSCHTGQWACGACRGCIKHNEVMNTIAKRLEASDGQ
jgi:7-cyano-7-deazaguanine synthase